MSDPGQAPIVSLNVLDHEACSAWSERVIGLRSHWTRRDPELPSYTLGLAAYCDAAPNEPRAPYRIDAFRAWNNRLLHQHFADLHERCCAAISSWSNTPAVCPGGAAALPGFHIHLPHPAFMNDVASRHVDLQFQRVFGLASCDPVTVLTFTLPVSMPSGAALRLWRSETEVTVHPYSLGVMTLHNGLSMHQAVLNPHGEPIARIMLQGHALLTDAGWWLYW